MVVNSEHNHFQTWCFLHTQNTTAFQMMQASWNWTKQLRHPLKTSQSTILSGQSIQWWFTSLFYGLWTLIVFYKLMINWNSCKVFALSLQKLNGYIKYFILIYTDDIQIIWLAFLMISLKLVFLFNCILLYYLWGCSISALYRKPIYIMLIHNFPALYSSSVGLMLRKERSLRL